MKYFSQTICRVPCPAPARGTPLLAVLVLGVLAATSVPASADARSRAPLAMDADSARAVAAARSAQARFELVRRNNLPWTGGVSRGECDERVGRFCLWYGDGESNWQPPPDPPPVARARTTLLERLDSAAARVPGDPWVAGQRVRYLIEAEDLDGAVAAARACRASEPGWCDSLLGFALHSAGEFERADAYFEAALASMSQRERRRWTDLSPLLEPDALRAYRRLGPRERELFEARFWWLADPLHLVPGNDRRTEHFARQVLDRLQDRARQTEGIRWGSDLRELLIRYGAPAGWERIRPRFGMDANAIVTRYPAGGRAFDPPLGFVEAPFEIPAGEWDLNARAARSSYAPGYAAPVRELQHQLGVFRRADSAVVVVAMRLPPDSAGIYHNADAALLLFETERAAPLKMAGASSAEPAVLMLKVPAAPMLLSAEALAREERSAARARYGLPLTALPAHGMAISDLLLLGSVEPLPQTLDEAAQHARATAEFVSGERVGIYWEVYGAAAGAPLDVAVQVTDARSGLLHRIAIRTGLRRADPPVAVRWREAAEVVDGALARSVELELADLTPGEYVIQLSVTAPGREPLRATRNIEVR